MEVVMPRTSDPPQSPVEVVAITGSLWYDQRLGGGRGWGTFHVSHGPDQTEQSQKGRLGRPRGLGPSGNRKWEEGVLMTEKGRSTLPY